MTDCLRAAARQSAPSPLKQHKSRLPNSCDNMVLTSVCLTELDVAFSTEVDCIVAENTAELIIGFSALAELEIELKCWVISSFSVPKQRKPIVLHQPLSDRSNRT